MTKQKHKLNIMFSSLHLASFLLFLSFFEYSVVFSQDPNLFLDPLPATGDNMDLLASSSLSSDPPPDNLLGDGTVNNMFIEDDPLLQAYCAKSNQQPGKARARRGDGGVVCSPGSSPAPPLTVPEFPDLLNSISGPGSSGEKFKNEGDVVGSFTLNTAEFYCSMFTSQPQLFIIPICGSGNYMDSVRIARAFYSTVFKSWLSKWVLFFPFFLSSSGIFSILSFDSPCETNLSHTRPNVKVLSSLYFKIIQLASFLTLRN